MFTLQSPATRRLNYMRRRYIWSTACSRELCEVTVHVCYRMLTQGYDAYLKVKCVLYAFLSFLLFDEIFMIHLYI